MRTNEIGGESISQGEKRVSFLADREEFGGMLQ